MKHLDLFSGIGGFALAARWMGWETIQFVEKDSFCQKVLNKNFTGIPIHDDIKTFDATKLWGAVDIITGGFPCQPFSHAGQRKGTEDDRYLWPEMLRVIRETKPSFILGENVYGFVNWSKGLVFDQVLSDLENEGYEIAPIILPACSVNAPHRRDRIWIVAYSNSNIRSKGWMYKKRPQETEGLISTFYPLQGRNWENFPTQPGICGRNDGIPAELHIIRRIENENKGSNTKTITERSIAIWKAMRTMWKHKSIAETSPELFVIQVCNSMSIMPCKSGPIGWLSENKEAKELRSMWQSFYSLTYEEAQDLQSRMLNYYREIERRKKMSIQRANRIKALGNAVVPQLVYQIFRAIQNTID